MTERARPVSKELEDFRAAVVAAVEVIDRAAVLHAAWKPAAFDAALHARMSDTYAGHTFETIRQALRREMLLALWQLWDSNRRALRMSKIRCWLADAAIIRELAEESASKMGAWPGVFEAILDESTKAATGLLSLINKYMEGGTGRIVLKKLDAMRHDHLAHRALQQGDGMLGVRDADVEQFFADCCAIVARLSSLAKRNAYNPAETHEVFLHYASKFWAGCQGDLSPHQ